MAVYDVNGNQLSAVYDVNGTSLQNAYDVNGNVIFTSGSGTSLKVMTYNCGGWWNGTGVSVPSAYDDLYYALQNGMISDNDPDILCIEEYRDSFSDSGRTALSMLSQYFPYIKTSHGTTDYWGRAICSKYPISNITSHSYSNESNRYYDSVTATVDDNEITVIVTHLSTTQSLREAQALELFNYVQTLDSFILCGDFNTTYADSTSGEEYTTVYLQYINAGYHLANCSEQNGFYYTYYASTSGMWRTLDNIITSADIYINSVVVDETKKDDPITSDPDWKIDHMPLIADLTIY